MNKLSSHSIIKIKKDYAPYMYIGEKKRDASDNIKGYVYQDIIAVYIILSSSSGDKIYVEWCEDICVENDDNISIYQVKYYPNTKIDSSKKNEISRNLFYQYLKYKLYEDEKNSKNMHTYLLYYSENMPINKSNIDINSVIKKNNILDEEIKEKIRFELESCNDMGERQTLLFDKVASNDLAKSFNYKLLSKETIEEEKDKLKDFLYKEFIECNAEMSFSNYNEDQIKDILFAVSIQYVQESYYKKTIVHRGDYKEREMTKEKLVEHVKKVIGQDEEIENNRIAYTLLNYIDDAFINWIKHIDDAEIETIKTYTDIYHSTKNFFLSNMQDKKNRCKFINTINESSELFDVNTKLHEEQIKTYELKIYITTYIKTIWKIMYDTDTKDFDNLLSEELDCYTVKFPNDNAKNSLIIPTISGNVISTATSCFERIYKMKNKPDKWYCHGLEGDEYSYTFKVKNIKDARITQKNISKIENDDENFYVKCLECVDYDMDGVSKKDDIRFLFTEKCKKGCKT